MGAIPPIYTPENLKRYASQIVDTPQGPLITARRLWTPLGYISEEKTRFFQLIGYVPYIWQAVFHWGCENVRFVHWGAGARAGKSHPAGVECAYELITSKLRSDNTGTQIWLVAPTYKQGLKEFDYCRRIITETFPMRTGKTIKLRKDVRNVEQGKLMLELYNRAWIHVKSCENTSQLLSEEIDKAVFCEGSEAPQVAWQRYISLRIVTRVGGVIAPTTGAGFNWVHDELFEKAGPEKLPGLGYTEHGVALRFTRSSHEDPEEVPEGEEYTEEDVYGEAPLDRRLEYPDSYMTIISPAYHSPFFPKEEKRRLLRRDASDTAEKDADRDEQVSGFFVQRTGLLLNAYRKKKHVIDWELCRKRYGWRDIPPPGWSIIATMDYGQSAPMATLVGALSPDRKILVVFWEWYEVECDIPEQVAALLTCPGVDSEGSVLIADRSAPIPEYNREIDDQARTKSLTVVKSASDPGQKRSLIAVANGFLKRMQVVFIGSACPNTLREIIRYRAKAKPKSDDADDRKDNVRKKDDHCMDCFQYMCAAAADEMVNPYEAQEPERQEERAPLAMGYGFSTSNAADALWNDVPASDYGYAEEDDVYGGMFDGM